MIQASKKRCPGDKLLKITLKSELEPTVIACLVDRDAH